MHPGFRTAIAFNSSLWRRAGTKMRSSICVFYEHGLSLTMTRRDKEVIRRVESHRKPPPRKFHGLQLQRIVAGLAQLRRIQTQRTFLGRVPNICGQQVWFVGMMGLVTGEARDLTFSECGIGSGDWMSRNRMICRKRFIQIQKLPALELSEGQSDTPWSLPRLFSSVDFESCACVAAQA
jgi:hypothetical protein